MPPGAHSLTDELAIERTRLANERTLLAYVRTGLAVAVGGVGIAHFVRGHLALPVGLGLVLLGALALSIGIWRFVRVRGELRELAERRSDG
jgi:putative membrane protein